MCKFKKDGAFEYEARVGKSPRQKVSFTGHTKPSSSLFLSRSTFIFLLWLLADYIHHGGLEDFFVFAESVLLPSEVSHSSIEIISYHAVIKEVHTFSIVWSVLEL